MSRSLSRRRLLGAVGGLAAAGAVAAGAGALAGCSPMTGGSTAESTDAEASENTVSNGHLRQYVSRPDLQPIAAAVTTSTEQDTAPGLICVAPYGGGHHGQQGPMILDNSGDLVWFRPTTDPASTKRKPYNFRVQQYQGKPVLTWFEGNLTEGHGRGRYAIADDSYRIRWVQAGNGLTGDLHEFLLTDRGTALFTCVANRHTTLRGRRRRYFDFLVQEVDVATGRVVFQWSAAEHISFAESYVAPTSGWWDPYHLNSVDVAPDGNLLFSVRNTWAVYKVHRSTGEILWRLGGKRSDFAVDSKAKFSWQHHVTQHPGGRFTVFDNGMSDSGSHPPSRGLLLSVDERSKKTGLIHEYLHDPAVYSYAQGSVQLLPDDHVLVGWGDGHYVTEYAPDGTAIRDFTLGVSKVRGYRAFRSAWTGRPSGSPALAVRKQSAGMRLYASWNGDTEVRHWRVLLGARHDSLSPAATAVRHGFETVITVSRQARYVAVAGLDGAGREIGRSAVQSL